MYKACSLFMCKKVNILELDAKVEMILVQYRGMLSYWYICTLYYMFKMFSIAMIVC